MNKTLIIIFSLFGVLTIGWIIKLGCVCAPGSYWSDYDTVDKLFIVGYVLTLTSPLWIGLIQKIRK